MKSKPIKAVLHKTGCRQNRRVSTKHDV